MAEEIDLAFEVKGKDQGHSIGCRSEWPVRKSGAKKKSDRLRMNIGAVSCSLAWTSYRNEFGAYTLPTKVFLERGPEAHDLIDQKPYIQSMKWLASVTGQPLAIEAPTALIGYLVWLGPLRSEISLVLWNQELTEPRPMERKSFDIAEAELNRARINAKAEGVSLNRYIRTAVTDKNECVSSSEYVAQMRDAVIAVVDEFRIEIARARLDVLTDSQRSGEVVREEMARSMKRNEELMKAFVRALGKQLSGGFDDKPSPGRPNWPQAIHTSDT